MAGFVGVVLAGLALFVAVGWHDVTRVRADLVTARDILQGIVDNPASLRTAEGRALTRTQAEAAVQAVASGRRRAHKSVVLSAARFIPGLRAQRSGLLTLIDDSAAAAGTGQDLLNKVDDRAGRAPIRDGAVPLDSVQDLVGEVRTSAAALGRLARSNSGLWGPLGDARERFDELAEASARRLSEGADALQAAQAFMGGGGGRRYLVALQNNTEMRDQGAVLSYVVIRFDGGRLTIGDSASVGKLSLDRPASTPIPEGTRQVFGSIEPTRLWQSVNATADFPFSGRAMADMFEQATGERVDGVVAIDIPGLAGLLGVLGPVEVPTIPETVHSLNLARILGHDIYQGLSPSTQPLREERYAELTRAVVDRLTSGTRDAVTLGRELGNAALGGHLRLWSRVEEEERVFERTGLGGGPGRVSPEQTFHLAVENRTATKLDFFVKPAVRQDVQLTESGTAIVRTTVVVENQAPVGAPPSYQLGPDAFMSAPGEYLAWLLLWAPSGAVQAGGVPESGLTLSQQVVPVAAGERRELTFETIVPNAVRDGRLTLRLVPQPRLEPVPLEVRLRADGWNVDGPPSFRGPWNQVLSLSWKVRR